MLRKKLFFTIFYFLIAGMVIYPSCSSDTTKTIGVTLLTKQLGFYQDLQKGLENAAKKYRYKLLVVSSEFDSAKQANQIDDFIVKKVDAMVICPCDSRSVGVSISAANRAKIPVFTSDIANLSRQGRVVSHVASDNIEGGRQAGKLMARALKGKGKIAIISHPLVTSVLDRVKGFKEVLSKYPDIKIVAETSAWGQRSKAMSVMEDLLQKFKDLDGVFGINDDTALGALAAIEAAGRAGKVIIVGYDATPEAKKAIQQGKIYGDAVQYPIKMGEATIEAIHKYFKGEKVSSFIPIEVGVWTRESK